MTEVDSLTRLVITLAQHVKRQQVEIRKLNGRLHTYETTVLFHLSTKDIQEFRKVEAAQVIAAQNAAQDDLTALISALSARLPSEGVSL